MAKSATILDVARVAGVSTATVSRALKQPDLVTHETRERVLEAVERISYTPNLMARNLRRQETRSIVMVVRNILNPFYLEIFHGVDEEARTRDFTVLMGNTEDDPAREQLYFDMVRERRVDGMILMTGKLPPAFGERRAGLRPELPPMVVANEYIPGHAIPTVQIDNVDAARQAVAHLAGLGHERVAHITGPMPEVMSRDRHLGYLAGLEAAGIRPDESLTAMGDFTLESGHRACRALLALEEPPTAIFCSNDEMAIGAINELRNAGLTVPRDVSVVGFDDIGFAADFYPPLTTVRQPRQDIGRRAMRMLAETLAGGSPPASPRILPTELVVRGSTAAPPAAGGRRSPS